MTTEEKARAYDEALKQIEECTPDENGFVTIYPSEIFPELKESENADEKVRKALIKLVTNHASMDLFIEYDIHLDEALDWLEKQGEQKPADPPKFKVGDWLTNGLKIRKIIAIGTGLYIMEREDGTEVSLSTNYVEKNYHLWTIQGAKEGDVLVHNGCTFIFMGIKNGIVQAIEETLLDDTNPVCFGEPDKDGDYHPATKKQRDLLFQKMREAGHEWDSEKKELKKIIDEKQIKKNLQDNSFRRMFEQKPAWSEEDEDYINDLIKYFSQNEKLKNTKEDVVVWLKSLKDRIQSQPKQEWKQENTGDLTDFENAMMHIGCSFFGQHAGLNPNDTNAIKEQANLLLELVPKQEWSKEDKENLLDVKCIIDEVWHNQYETEHSDEELEMLWHWLDNIWQRVEYPQTIWKPSDEQMEALKNAIHIKPFENPSDSILWGLYEQLKKLKG